MRTITTSTGAGIALDGDLLAIIETLFQEVTAKRQLERSYEDMMQEIRHLIEQMTDAELRDYLAESLFHNTVRFENDRLATYMQQLAAPEPRRATTSAPKKRTGARNAKLRKASAAKRPLPTAGHVANRKPAGHGGKPAVAKAATRNPGAAKRAATANAAKKKKKTAGTTKATARRGR